MGKLQVYEIMKDEDGTQRDGIPLFDNAISRKIGPPPPLDIEAEIKNAGGMPAVLSPNGEFVQICGMNHGVVSQRRAMVGVCRLVPYWPEIGEDSRLKLWFLGRTEFTKLPDTQTSVALSNDVYVHRRGSFGDISAHLVLGFIGANGKIHTLDADKFLASGYALDSFEWRKLATERGYP